MQESPYLRAVSELLSVSGVTLSTLLIPLRLRYVHLALAKNVQLVYRTLRPRLRKS